MAGNPVESAPNPIELQEFQFKLFSRLRVFPEDSSLCINSNLSLVCSASRYGLLFVGCPTGFQVLQTSKIVELQDSQGKSRNELVEFPRREISLTSQPVYLGVSCDHQFLAVAFSTNSSYNIKLYYVPSFYSQSVRVLQEVRATSDLNTHITGFCWNPGVPNLLALCLSDGSVHVYEFKETTFVLNSTPPEARATCLCWSPKGKQIVLGSVDGTLTQYKPELKAVKQLPAPVINQHAVSVVNVHWLSNYQFAAVYRDVEDLNERPALMIVNAPKSGPQTFINYEDICYSTGNLRPPQFYLEHLQQWKVLVVGTGNSIEVGVLGCINRASDEWQQWVQDDSSRADLPLSKLHQETFPVGLAIDTSIEYCLPCGENQKYPPMPVLCLYSHDGLLCIYFIVNSLQNAEQICAPPSLPADQSGLPLFTNMVLKPKVAVAPELNQGDFSSTAPVAQVAPFGTTHQLAAVAPVSGSPQAPISSIGGLQPSFFTETPAIQSSWMTGSMSLQKVENKGKENSGIENITPPHGGIQPTPVSVTGGVSLFSGSGLSFQKTSQQPQQLQQQLPLQPQMPQQLQQTPQKQQVPLSFAFNPVTPSGPPPSVFGRNTSNANIISPVFEKGLTVTAPGGNVQNLSDMSSVAVSTPLNQSVQIEQPQPVISTSLVAPENINRSLVQPSSPAVLPPITQEGVATESTQESVLMREEVVNAAIVEEVAHFDAELKELFNSFRNIDTKIGEKSEKINISTKLEYLESFCNEVTEATNGLKNEVDVLKNTMLETFCFVEDAKARDYQSKNPGYKKLMYSQELDPVIKRKLNNINHYTYYINNQIKEASRVINDRWILYQDKRKAVKGGLRVPPREELFQALVMQNNIINKHKLMLEDIQRRIRQRNQKLQNNAPLITNLGSKKKILYNRGDTELSKLAENLLQVKLNEAEYSKLNSSIERPSNKAISTVTKENLLVTEEKKNLLRQIHSEIMTSIPKVRVPQPFTVSKPSGVSPYTSTPKVSAVNPDSMSPGEKLLQKYLKSELNKVKSDPFVIKNSNALKTQSNSPDPVSIKSTLLQRTTEASLEFSPDINQQKDTLVKWNQKDIKSTLNSTTDLVKPVVIQAPANFLSLNKETVTISASNKESFSSIGISPSLNKSTDKTDVSLSNMEKYLSAPIFKMPGQPAAQTSVSPALGGSSLVEDHQKTQSPLVSINKIVSSIGELPDSNVSAQTNPPSLFSNLGNQQTSLPGLFSSPNQSLQTKGLNQEQQKPQTIFGDAFNKSQAMTKQSVEESKSSTTGFSSPSLFKEVSSTPPSSSSNSSLASTLSFGVQESQNKPGSIFSGKQTTSTLNVDFGKSVPVVSPNVSLDQVQKSKDTSKSEDVTSLLSKESISDQTIQVSKPGSIFGGMGAPASTTPGTFSFGLGKSMFGGNSATSSAGQTGFTFGSNLSTSATVGNTANPGDQFQFSFSSAAPNVSSTTSFGTLFSSAGSATGNGSSVTTVATVVQSSSSFSFSKAFAVSSGQPPNLSTDANSSNGNSNLVTSGVSSSAAVVSTSGVPTYSSVSVSTSVPTTPISAITTPISTTTDSVAHTPSSITVAGSTTSSSLNAPGTAVTTSPVSPVTSSSDSVSSAVSNVPSPDVSKVVSGNSTVNTPVVTSPPTSNSSVTSNPKASETTPVVSSPSNTFSFGKLTVSSTDNSTPTTPSSAANFSFAQMLSTTSPDSGAKMNLQFGQQSSTLGPSLFGGTPNSAVSQPTNLFGQATPQTAVSTQSSTPFSFTLSPESSQQPSTTASFFNGKTLFGSTPGATTTTATTSFFGQPVSTPASTTASNIFGQSLASSTPSLFGAAAQTSGFGTPTFGSKTSFGQSTGSLFGQSSSGGFGANSGSVFGGSSVFGGAAGSPDNPAQPGSLFQTPGSGGGLFGARANAGTSPGGSFSTGGQTISQTGFGPPAFQSKPGGFGSSPPSFGSAPSFGGAPTFGGSPTFGNPGKVFGSTSPNVGFGSGSQQSTTFENLANQNTMSFGNLAQTQQQPGFASGTSLFGGTTQGTPAPAPAFPPTTFGGNSFSTWR